MRVECASEVVEIDAEFCEQMSAHSRRGSRFAPGDGQSIASVGRDSRAQVPSHLYLYRVNRLEEEIRTILQLDRDVLAREVEKTPIRKIGEALLYFLGRCNHIDLFANNTFYARSSRLELAGRLRFMSDLLGLRRIERSDWHRKRRPFLDRLWPHCLDAVWVLSVVHLIACLVFQYKYDCYKFRQKRVTWLNETHPDLFHAQRLETRDLLEAKLAEAAGTLHKLGSSPSAVSFLSECIVSVLVGVTVICYALIGLYYRYKRPYYSDFIVNLLDYAQETENCRRTIKEQARLFLESGRSFDRALEEFRAKSLGRAPLERGAGRKSDVDPCDELDDLGRVPVQLTDGQEQAPRGWPTMPRSTSGSLKVTQMRCGTSVPCRHLKTMILYDQLMPPNRSPEWLGTLLKAYTILSLAAIIIIAATNHQVIKEVVALTRQDIATDAAGTIYWLELHLLFVLWDLAILFHGSVVFFGCYDQTLLAKRLMTLINKLVQLNSLRFYGALKPMLDQELLASKHFSAAGRSARDSSGETRRLLSKVEERDEDEASADWLAGAPHDGSAPVWLKRGAPELSHKPLEDKMNRDLMLVIMHYRLFFVRLEDFSRLCRVVAYTLVTLLFLSPVIGRLHQPYFINPNSNSILLALCMLILIPVDCYLLPACYLNRRCLDLYMTLNSVVAHVTDTANQFRARHIYDQHLVSLLRKELCLHEASAARFATKFAGIKVTYANLMRIHLYFGFIILSLISEDPSEDQSVTRNIFGDPFRLF